MLNVNEWKKVTVKKLLSDIDFSMSKAYDYADAEDVEAVKEAKRFAQYLKEELKAVAEEYNDVEERA